MVSLEEIELRVMMAKYLILDDENEMIVGTCEDILELEEIIQ